LRAAVICAADDFTGDGMIGPFGMSGTAERAGRGRPHRLPTFPPHSRAETATVTVAAEIIVIFISLLPIFIRVFSRHAERAR